MTTPCRQAAGACLALALLAAPAAAEDRSSPNPASHAPAFLEELLAGRAYVYAKPRNRGGTWDESGRVAGALFLAGGAAFTCTRLKGATKTFTANWRVRPSGRHRSFLAIWAKKEHADDLRYHSVPFYDGESGRLREEAWSGRDLRWYVWTEGWVQESWPRVLADMCPDLVGKLPEGMAVNEAQTENWIGRLWKQDPDAALARFPGWEDGGPGGGRAGRPPGGGRGKYE